VLNLFDRLTPAAWGDRIPSEAATAVVAWAGTVKPDLPIIARVRPDNIASRRVAVRTGLQRAEHLDEEGEDGLDLIFAARWR
jgi:ribosomal-protein-alanine N-acetyltransferase